MAHTFRLTFHSQSPGFFRVDDTSATVELPDGTTLTLVPRDADKLIDATRYHFESRGYSTKESARSAGEKLRKSLTLLSCMLNLPIVVPTVDREGAKLAEDIRRDLEKKHGIRVFNTGIGLRTIPEDRTFIELSMSGRGETFPEEPLYLLDAIASAWKYDLSLDDRSKLAIEMISLSISSGNSSIRFLTTYLALEQLIPRSDRSHQAQALVSSLLSTVESSDLDADEKNGLTGTLGQLKKNSFRTDLRNYMKLIVSPTDIEGFELVQLGEECTRLRNAIAHRLSVEKNFDIPKLTKALRTLVLQIVWTRNELPSISVHRPRDIIKMENMDLRFL